MTRWHEQPLTQRDGFRLLLAWVLMDAIANGQVLSAFIAGAAP